MDDDDGETRLVGGNKLSTMASISLFALSFCSISL